MRTFACRIAIDFSPLGVPTMIPFNRPSANGAELEYIHQVLAAGHLSGDGAFTKRCHAMLEAITGTPKALLTTSCTAALDMAALLLDVRPGDEVIMPSYTFVSTANAFALRGAVPVFVDIDDRTLGLDATILQGAITSRTRCIVPVHYAGVACEMDAICELAKRYGLSVVEDAAQGLGATFRGTPLGTMGQLGALSFHETKNVICGEGGALLVNDVGFAERAEIIREKGTNRSAFFRGDVDKYTWVDLGSSFLPSEVLAAFLCAQLERVEKITAERHAIWNAYHEAFADLEAQGRVRRPRIPADREHNAHMYYLLVAGLEERSALLAALRARGVRAVHHYVPLHSSPAGRRYGRAHGALRVTDAVSERLLRLPLWSGMGQEVSEVIQSIREFFGAPRERLAT